MMRFLLIILLSISLHARSAVTFDSLFKQSTLIAGGRIIHQEVSGTGNPDNPWQCKFDFVIVHLGAAGQITFDSLLHYYPGDTLYGLTYSADSLSDTVGRGDYFVLPLQTQPLNRKKFALSCCDSRKGIFTDQRLLYDHCSVFLDLPGPGLINTVYVNKNRGWYNFTFYNKQNTRIAFESHKEKSPNHFTSKMREYDDSGKILNRQWRRTKFNTGGTKFVVWKFRRNGRICLKRSVYKAAKAVY